MRLNETCNMIIEQEYIENVVFSQPDVLPLAAVGDFGALNCQPSTNVDRYTALNLTTSAPIAANGCYLLGFL
jgi:hypothetical protein